MLDYSLFQMRPAVLGIGSPLYHIIPHLASSREAYLKLIRTFASMTGDRPSVNSGNDHLDGPLIMYFEKQLSQVCLIIFFKYNFLEEPSSLCSGWCLGFICSRL